jgi:hypothetical protein
MAEDFELTLWAEALETWVMRTFCVAPGYLVESDDTFLMGELV